ncbi:uncharacterized protein LOC106666966 isoform X1 [Cimex lectularius]|uniref:Macro domain-containing protein n=2 Tax=Cimex lectularius TaxID=79782 RepID=A0A8I6RR81_CIMLE|nr:uncharacterized protein LOC106666966 isoform X1 [Cimex lectularius]
MLVQKCVRAGLRPLRTLLKGTSNSKLSFPPQSFNYGILSQEFVQIFETREKYLTMPLEQKRELYKSEFVKLKDIVPWSEHYEKDNYRLKAQFKEYFKDKSIEGEYPVNEEINKKVAIMSGDITLLEVDAIVNAANNSLLGGGGVDGAIHRAAGPDLLKECRMLNGCKTGEAKLTGGYQLPAKYVIHTVGPKGEKPDLLKSCYQKCLEIAAGEQMRSIAFPCISTGIYDYPQEAAALVALKVVRTYLEANPKNLDLVVFCTFLPTDLTIYENLMQLFFPQS